MRKPNPELDASDFVLLADYVPSIIQEIRYHSTYNFIGERIDGYEEPTALLTKQAADSLKAVSDDVIKFPLIFPVTCWHKTCVSCFFIRSISFKSFIIY